MLDFIFLSWLYVVIIVKETYSRERVCQNKTDTGFSHYRRPALEKALEIMFNNTDEESQILGQVL